MGIILWAALLLGCPALLLSLQSPAFAHPQVLGKFKLTYYFVAQQKHSGGKWPVYGQGCATVLAWVSKDFHDNLSLEGTGRLLGGSLLNFKERCVCAKPGFNQSRICYQVLDEDRFPWGQGAPLPGGAYALRPFRSVAVDPRQIPLGSILYLPEVRGTRGPDGRVLEGCVKAVDTGLLIRGRHLDFFAGTQAWMGALRPLVPARRVRVILGEPSCQKPAAYFAPVPK